MNDANFVRPQCCIVSTLPFTLVDRTNASNNQATHRRSLIDVHRPVVPSRPGCSGQRRKGRRGHGLRDLAQEQHQAVPQVQSPFTRPSRCLFSPFCRTDPPSLCVLGHFRSDFLSSSSFLVSHRGWFVLPPEGVSMASSRIFCVWFGWDGKNGPCRATAMCGSKRLAHSRKNKVTCAFICS